MGAVTTAIALGSLLAHQVESSNQQRRLAGQEANRQRAAFDQQEQDLKRQQEEDQKKYDLANLRQQRRTRAAISGTDNRGGTLLTSPIGIPGPAANSGAKTLLGS